MLTLFNLKDVYWTNHNYHIGNVALLSVNTVCDLGVTYNIHRSFTQHNDNIVCKASLRAKLILDCFQSREAHLLDRIFFWHLFSQFLSIVLSYWVHYTNITSIRLKLSNSVLQKLHGFYKLSYENRSSRLGLESRLHRRVKTDFVMC